MIMIPIPPARPDRYNPYRQYIYAPGYSVKPQVRTTRSAKSYACLNDKCDVSYETKKELVQHVTEKHHWCQECMRYWVDHTEFTNVRYSSSGA
jgi:hypothetical protein